MLSPLTLLLSLIALTAAAATLSELLGRRRAAAVAAVAARWHMRYLHDDPFHLAPRVAAALPIPGAADVVVKDLIYGQDPHQGDRAAPADPSQTLRYFFTVEYTVGVLRGKRRHVAVGTLTESRSPAAGQLYSGVVLAPLHLPLVARYEHLRAALAPGLDSNP